MDDFPNTQTPWHIHFEKWISQIWTFGEDIKALYVFYQGILNMTRVKAYFSVSTEISDFRQIW